MTPGTGSLAILPFIMSIPIASGLSGSILSHPWAILLILLGLFGFVLGVTGIVQTRTWPKSERATPKAEPQHDSDTATTQDPRAAPPPPSPIASDPVKGMTTIHLPAIEERHPDVWGPDAPLDVLVSTRLQQQSGQTLEAALSLRQDGHETLVGRLELDAQGQARSQVQVNKKGEASVIARIQRNGTTEDTTHRSIRFVDYRNEIVETFEDFEKWATSHYPPLARRLTAREFVDRYADLVPGTPIEPLDRIVDLYELANYSDHPVDRATYLELVDAFLRLEDAGSLDGPRAEAD